MFTLIPLLSGQGRARHGRLLGEAAALIDAGLIRPLLDPQRLTLAQAQQAHELVSSGTARGKVVVDIE